MNDLIGFRGDFVNVERHNGHEWIMKAYNQGLAVAREVGRQGI